MNRRKPWDWKKKKTERPEGSSAGARPRSHLPPTPHTPAKPRGHTPSAPGDREIVEGALQLKGQFGFVLSEDPSKGDVMISAPTIKLAMNGDRVRARVTSAPDAIRRAGDIIEIITHSRTTVVGVFRRMGNLPVVAPDDDGPLVHLVDLKSLVPHVGDIVTAKIQSWATDKDASKGVLQEVLGPRDAPGVDLQSLVRKYELPDAFPETVAKQAESFGEEVPDSAWQDRETFFDRRVVTIDGADAKDFDDAVSLERIPADSSAGALREGGWRLGVHIADVAQYVTEGSPLDEEAYARGTSVYLSGTVLPMLPFPLSDNLCSLRPDRVRLTLSCVMDINLEGHIVDARVLESAIRSARRFTYDEVDQVLKGETVPNVTPEIAADVREMGKLARLMRSKRFGRGSLDFDFPEPEVIAGLDGRPTDIRKRERLESHRLIEDFMLLANESVARHMQSHPFLYRIHETPDPTKLEKLQKTLEVLGLHIPKHIDTKHPSAMQQVIKASEGTPVQAMVHIMILRSLKQAVYSPVNKGHYGLASTCYTHFTSPIRRYPDLIVHRIVKEGLHHHARDAHWKKELPAIANHASKRERTAVDAEREYLDIQKVRLMEPHVGESFTGTISSVTNFGLFVQLDDYFVEGLVHVTQLGNDYYVFDEARMSLRGRRTGKTYAMGQKVKIQLAAANILKHQLDFHLLNESSSGPRDKKPQRRGRHNGRR